MTIAFISFVVNAVAVVLNIHGLRAKNQEVGAESFFIGACSVAALFSIFHLVGIAFGAP